MATIIKYKNITIDHDKYIKVLSYGTVYYPTVSDDDVLDTTNMETSSTEPTKKSEEFFVIKFQEVYVLK